MDEKKMEQKLEVREWREEDPLPRRSDGIVTACVQYNILWALGYDWCHQVILSYLIAMRFHFALSNLVGQ
jgi:hypothetical protein